MPVTSNRVATCEALGPNGPKGGLRLVTAVSGEEREKGPASWCRAVKTTEGNLDFI